MTETEDAGAPAGYEAAKALRIACRKAERGYRKKLQDNLIGAYEVALGFVRNDDTWEDFIADPFWTTSAAIGRPTSQDRENALEHMLVFVFDAESPQGRNRITKYLGAMNRYFAAQRSADRLRKALKRAHGVDGLYRQECKRAKKLAAKKAGRGGGGRVDGVSALQIEVTTNQQQRALGIDVGESVRITCERVNCESDWVRLVANKVRVVRPKQTADEDEW